MPSAATAFAASASFANMTRIVALHGIDACSSATGASMRRMTRHSHAGDGRNNAAA
jgi:hypothetical protein